MKKTTFKTHCYSWSGIKGHGTQLTGEINAISRNHARYLLKQKGEK